MDANTPEERPACPTWDTLVGFHNGALPVMDLEAVAGHLSGCTRCERALLDLDVSGPVDDALALLRRWQEWPSVLNEPGWARMQAGAEALLGGNSTVAEAARTEEAQRWLGQTVGHYEILDKLGRGGMGVVYKARQQPLGRLVALKMILAGVHAPRDHRDRFVTEGKAAARLEHPGVVRIYDFDEHEGLPFYTMELVPGESLEGRLKRGPLEPREAADLLRRLAEAVEYAHRNKVLHRDLKPGNVLLGVEGAPKITDFGLAKLLDTEGMVQTATDVVVGTAAYMAPEQAEARQADLGPATDVWALGVILYECLTGRSPFRGADRFETMRLVRQAEPAAPSGRRRGIPRDLDAVCLTCLRKAPAERYPSAAALAADLDRWLNGQRLVGTPPWPRRLWWGLRRAGRVLTRPVVLLGLILVGVIGLVVYLNALDPAKREAEIARQRIEGDLSAGQAVTLVEATGEPPAFRWLTGGASSNASVAVDGTFTLHSWSYGLLELLPMSPRDSYRLQAQVRHWRSDVTGEAGLYFAHQAHPGTNAAIHFFLQVSFNDVRGTADVVPAAPAAARRAPRDNVVRLRPHLHSEEERRSFIDWQMPGVAGPSFKHSGENNDRWHDLEINVSPAGVTARWYGKSFTLAVAALEETIKKEMAAMRPVYATDPFVQQLRPTFDPRGGVGLYVKRGSASFRSVIVAPGRETP